MHGLDAFESTPEPGIVRDAEKRAEQKRVEKLFAKLAVSGPHFAVPVPPERKNVDKYRLRAMELDVIGARIRQADAASQRFDLDIEMQQRRRLDQREGPFLRIGDERNAPVPQHHLGLDSRFRQDLAIDFLGGNDLAFGGKPVE
jgi:hypothetical protein